MGYQINKNYEVREGHIETVSKNEDYNCLSLNLKVWVFNQGYPACRTNGGYEEQIAYLKEVFEVEDEKDLIGKKFIAICSSCDVFCLFNPENSQFFSMQAKFFPEKYADALEEIKKEHNIEFFEKLDDFNKLMTGVVKAQKDQNADILIFSQLMDKHNLKVKLEDKLTPISTKSKTKKI